MFPLLLRGKTTGNAEGRKARLRRHSSKALIHAGSSSAPKSFPTTSGDPTSACGKRSASLVVSKGLAALRPRATSGKDDPAAPTAFKHQNPPPPPKISIITTPAGGCQLKDDKSSMRATVWVGKCSHGDGEKTGLLGIPSRSGFPPYLWRTAIFLATRRHR